MADRLGDRVGPRLATLIGQYTLAARTAHAPIEAKVRQVAMQKLIDRAGQEVADHIAPMLAAAIEANPDMDDRVRGYLLRTASGKHQLQAIAGHLALAGAGSVLGTLLSNELGPFAYAVVAANPHLRLEPQAAAQAYAVGNFTQQDMYNEGAASGLNSIRMDTLAALSEAIPDAATIGELVNRGELTEVDARYWIERGGYSQRLHDPLLNTRRQLLSVADAALAVLRTEISEDAGRAIAAANGMTAADFDIFVTNTGEPPGPEQLQEAYRRGFIDQARFAKGIAQSRVRNEWLDVELALRFEPMSTADAVEAVVQNHLQAPQAAAIAAQNGLEASAFPVLVENAGEPLSRTELEQLYNRGLISEAVVTQGLRESRLKDKYVADALQLHVRLPEPRQVVAMISHGVITKPAGIKLLLEYGFSEQTAADLVAEGVATRLGAHHTLTLAEIKSLFADGVFTEAQTLQHLETLGYDGEDSGYLIASWKLLQGAAQLRQAVNLVRSKYVAHHFDEVQARSYLHSLNVGAAAVDRYLVIWNIERDTVTAVLSESQIVKAHKDGLITGQDAYDRLLAHGYDQGDALILLGVAPGSPIPA